MIKDKNIEFEISKLQKQLDRKKATSIVNNTTNIIGSEQSANILGKPVANDMTPVDGQALIYNASKKRWEPGNLV